MFYYCWLLGRLVVGGGHARMLRQQRGPVSSTSSRPLDLTVHGDDGTPSLHPVQQSLPKTLNQSAVLQSPFDTFRTYSEDLRLRSYSYGTTRSIEATRANHRTCVEERRGEWIDQKSKYRRLVELPWRHPGVVDSCWTLASADHGQFII